MANPERQTTAISEISRKKVDVRLREKRVLEMRLSGQTFAAIAQVLGVSEVAAFKAYKRALDGIPTPAAAAERKASLARIDSHQLLINEKLDQLRLLPALPATCDSIAKLEIAFFKWETRRALLLGLDQARVKVAVDVSAKFGPQELTAARGVLLDALAADRAHAGAQDAAVETSATPTVSEPAQLDYQPASEPAEPEGGRYSAIDLASVRETNDAEG
jgi:hypothetical protein